MIYVPDTNVLLRYAMRADPQHLLVLAAIKTLDQLRMKFVFCRRYASNFGMLPHARFLPTALAFLSIRPTILLN